MNSGSLTSINTNTVETEPPMVTAVCVICYDELHQDNAAGTWPCRHRLFCVACIIRWCEERDIWTCPLCRTVTVALLYLDSGRLQICFKRTRVSFEAVMSSAPDLLDFAESVMDGFQQRCKVRPFLTIQIRMH
jgi:hypothetical protein